MPRKYTKIEMLSDEIFRLKEHGKTHREIGELYGLTKEQIKGFVNRQNRKQRLLDQGYVPRPKGRPRKNAVDIVVKQNCNIWVSWTYNENLASKGVR